MEKHSAARSAEENEKERDPKWSVWIVRQREMVLTLTQQAPGEANRLEYAGHLSVEQCSPLAGRGRFLASDQKGLWGGGRLAVLTFDCVNLDTDVFFNDLCQRVTGGTDDAQGLRDRVKHRGARLPAPVYLKQKKRALVGKDHREKKYKAHRQFGDRRGGVISARTYFYADEAKCDHHMETFLNCIRASGGSSDDGFSAIKMTALGRPQFLVSAGVGGGSEADKLQFSEVLVKWRRFFSFLAAQQGKAGMEALEQKLELQQLQECLTKLGAKEDIQNWFTGERLGSSGTIDLLDWNSLIDERTKISNLLVVPNLETGQLEPLLSRFTEEEEKQMKRMLQRMDILAKHAVENGVRLMVDAEQTYFQPAISRLTLEMQRIFNREKPIIFNTYQCYLKLRELTHFRRSGPYDFCVFPFGLCNVPVPMQEAYDNVSLDVELSRREGWYFGAKLVRGAYMHQERTRAEEIGYEDPINPDYESTNRMYHKCLDYVLEEIEHNRKANVMVASHNEDTKKVYFGQLLGMCDQISFPLAYSFLCLWVCPVSIGSNGVGSSHSKNTSAVGPLSKALNPTLLPGRIGQAGFPVYKYVPYGPVNEVIPYLSRRAQENRGFMKGSKRERVLLWEELKRRALSGELLYRPAV
ncbi:hypothetical protein JZ751_023483 [Albula glossodonta]|uniref:Proline dehydrogenase n=1 Tax=Albula glossodonta TaxID=121402 RepID=A0A8T2NPQ9_9TELE|nr:hypothetical protein JZ751_023483 [Albula glossodonta]